MNQYDYLIVGAGLYGATFAYQAHQQGKKCLVIDKRSHLGGNIYCECIECINVHKYGPHIFHTSNKEVWNFVNSIVEFNHFIYCPLANYKGRLYNLPFNMNTFYALWGIKTPKEAENKIEKQRKEINITKSKNLEEHAISLVGKEIYEILIKGYTEKQWGRKCTDLPDFIIKRLPVRFTFNNNYFNDVYQGIPIGGYNRLIDGLLSGIAIKCNTDFFKNRKYFESIANRIVFTGKIDEFYNYRYGKLE
jgi:UDP-galactopyranose mutase